ncbi:carbohydrate ABC transporter permease [Alicyclobacillus macrosporangiidus]|uniref:sn-glycerol 3-phosphate transport system permease protein n=1 Tax=Alicyclobacillus macrosporangiidus TaxID=392015 RepID=A0A1I7JRD0_9BACL|nr:carbohydrate ABC transporter permease [Alicyclobacillus macrosporangiidus]SFU87717.1 sn-glycerol 3-phosphate transport system permease protein [Alicyclobacillus macrosporangiidus]
MKENRVWLVIRYILLIIASLVVCFPILYSLLISLETSEHVSTYPPQLWPHPFHFASYAEALQAAPLGRFLLNSFIMSAIIVCGQIVTSLLAAYAFVYLRFRGRGVLFLVFLATMMIPTEVTMIPNYMTIRSLGWLDSFAGLTVPFLANAFGIFLLRQYLLQLPYELFEAAKMDGAGHWRFLISVVVPLSRPILATLAVYVFLQSWNMYLWPLLTTNSTSMRTVQVGLGMLQNQDALSWNLTMAGVVIISLPTLILLFFAQKHLVKGLTAGAVKG